MNLDELLSNFQSLVTQYGASPSSAASSNPTADASSTSNSTTWLGAPTAQNFIDLTDHVEKTSLDILNADSAFGSARDLLLSTAPAGLKHKNPSNKDFVVSDTDEQLMLFLPFQTAVKLHSIQITSIPPSTESTADLDDDEIPTRPRRIKIFANTSGILGFEDGEERAATQEIELKPTDWDSKTQTANVLTRFVKFQNCSSLTVFFVEGEREGAEKIRIDRVRLLGEKLYEKPDLMRMKQMEKEDREA